MAWLCGLSIPKAVFIIGSPGALPSPISPPKIDPKKASKAIPKGPSNFPSKGFKIPPENNFF